MGVTLVSGEDFMLLRVKSECDAHSNQQGKVMFGRGTLGFTSMMMTALQLTQ